MLELGPAVRTAGVDAGPLFDAFTMVEMSAEGLDDVLSFELFVEAYRADVFAEGGLDHVFKLVVLVGFDGGVDGVGDIWLNQSYSA